MNVTSNSPELIPNVAVVDCLVAFGSNQGDSRALYAAARHRLGRIANGNVVASEPVQTRAIGGHSDQADYLNGVFRFRTELDPIQLHAELIEIETELGRQRRERWGPRQIDLDLLLFGDLIMENATLTIPHPRMSFRRFVLEPANEIASDMMHPKSGLTIGELLARISRDRKELLWITSRPKFVVEVVKELEETFAKWVFYVVVNVDESLPESPNLMIYDNASFASVWNGPSLNVSGCSLPEIKTEVFAAIEAIGAT